MSNTQLALFEPSPLELWKVRGGGAVRLFRSLIPEAWSSGLEKMLKYEVLLAPYVGEHYSADRVDAAIEDEALVASLIVASKAAESLAERHPFLLLMPTPVWMLVWTFVPWQSLWDRPLRNRVTRALRVMKEMMGDVPMLASRQAIYRDFHLLDTPRERATWFVYDPTIPAEVAKRMLAGLRARVTMDLVQSARRGRSWQQDDMKRALVDWADSTEYAIGLFASQPGIVVPSLPRTQLFDLSSEIKRHEQRRQRLSDDASRAATELKK